MNFEYSLNEQQLKNLNVFLDRTNLTGTEAMAFLELKRIFNLNVLQNKTNIPGNKKV